MSRRGCWYAIFAVVVGLTLCSGVAAAEPLVDLDPETDLDGSGTESDPYEIGNSSELQAINGNLSANYTLTNGIDASNTSAWNGGAGFEPIGNSTDPFTGSFNGNEQTISGLSINRNTDNDIGLFGYTSGALIERVGLEDVDVNGDTRVGGLVGNNAGSTVTESNANGSVVGNSRVGGLVGNNAGNSNVTESYTTGSVVGSGDYIGGLVGYNSLGAVTASYATSDVDGANTVGGLVGYNQAGTNEITESHATGTVDGADTVGGLVGQNEGIVTTSYATGSVIGTGEYIGGLVGYNEDATVTESYATGDVDGDLEVGGLVGYNYFDAVVNKSYATGDVDGDDTVGGLIGWNRGSNVTTAYATGAVTGNTFVGGLVGYNHDDGILEDAYWDRGTTNQNNETGGGTGTTANLTGFGAVADTDPAIEMTDLNATIEMDRLGFYGPWMPRDGDYPDLAWDSTFVDGPDAFDTLVAGNGDADPYEITNVYELQSIRLQRSSNHELTTDIDASTTDNWGSLGKGFEPLGNDTNPFVDSFEGNGHSIEGVTIDRPNESYVGLFGVTGVASTVSNVTVTAAEITGNRYVGTLVGQNGGTVSGSDVSTDVSGESPPMEGGPRSVGGLVGVNDGDVTDSSASGTVSVPGGDSVGGLVGRNTDSVVASSANMTVSASGGDSVGGLVGLNDGEVLDSGASGTVTAPDGQSIGGLVGYSFGSSTSEAISNTTASVAVSAPRGQSVGGLLGGGGGFAEVIESSATGTVSGETDVGGLVGATESNISRSFATGTVAGNTTSGDNVGGLVGDSNGPIGNSSAFGDVTGNNSVGGFAGVVRDTFAGSEIAASYSVGTVSGTTNVGGFAGEVSTITVVDSYWDTEASGTATATGTGPTTNSTGLTTSELQGSASTENTNLAFNPVWIATDGYPIHVWRVDDYDLSVGQTTLAPGETTTSTVTLSLSNGSTTTATEPADYSSTNTDRITVDDGGQVTADDSGSATLTAAASGFDDTLSLSVSAPSSPSSSSLSSSSADDDDEEPPEEPPEEPSDDETAGSDSSTGSETADTEETVVESVDEPRRFSAVEIGVGGGAGIFGTYVMIVLVSRTELFVAAAPASVAKAVAAMPGTAGFLLSEPEQAAFVVGSVTLADSDDDTDDETDSDVAAGETVAIDVTIENKGDIPGARVVTLTLNEAEDSATLDIPAHTAHSVVLEYQTSLADAGKTLGFTIDCETDSTDIDITVAELTHEDDESMNETTADPDDAGTDDDQTSGETVDPDTTDDEEIDTEVSEDELDEGTRTGFVDRLWLQKGKILSYTAGLIIIYIGTTNLETNVFAGGLGIFLGVMALPIVRAQLPTSTRVLISRYGKVVVVIIAALFSGVLVDPAVVFERIQELFR